MENSNTNLLRWAWLVALGCLVLAGSTGALIRFGMLYGFPLGLQYVNVRHAHSHLMVFGWVTPALMALIVVWLPRVTGQPLSPRLQAGFQATIGAIFVLALLAYGFFLLYGYRALANGLPLSTIAAGLNTVGWYVFISLYWQATRGASRSAQPLRLWDAALGFLLLASLGAWGTAAVSRLRLEDPFWSLALTHLFLDLFAEGWLVLAALGLAGHMVALWPAVSSSWRAPLAFLGLKALAALAITIPALALWLESASLRISYLHWLLLGFVTLAAVAAARATWGEAVTRYRRWLTVAVTMLLLTLIPMTRLWPAAWSGRWQLVAAAWAALGPVVVVAAMLLATWRQQVKIGRLQQAIGTA